MIASINAAGRTKATKDKVYIADWRYGADYVVSDATDNLFADGTDVAAELAGYKHNVVPGMFIGRFQGYQDHILRFGKYDLYFPSDRWKIGASNFVIPDYYATAWTSAGAGVFNVTAGEEKEARYPNHGQEMFDVSNGVYGYDFNTDTVGTNNLAELYDMVEDMDSWFFGQFGHYPSTIAYRNGQYGASKLLDGYYLGGRNSDYEIGDAYTKGGVNYGTFLGNPIGFVDEKGKTSVSCTFRYRSFAEANSYPQSILLLKSIIADTASNKGYFHNFFHWHFMSKFELEKIIDCYAAQQEQIELQSEFCWKATFGEIYEYIAARKCVSSLWWEPNGSNVDIKIRFYQQGQIPTDRIYTPITVIFDTTGTSLVGADITCATATGIRKISANVFAIDLDFTLGLQTHTVISTASPSYYDFTKPTINSVTRSGNDLTVTTDIPCALSVFKGTSEISQNIATATRVNTFSNSHTVTLNSTDYDNSLWIGVISERGESILSSALTL